MFPALARRPEENPSIVSTTDGSCCCERQKRRNETDRKWSETLEGELAGQASLNKRGWRGARGCASLIQSRFCAADVATGRM